MYSLNEVNLIGNFTSNPEIKVLSSNTNLCNFSVATNESKKLESGEYESIPEFHNCVAFGKLADLIVSKGEKGKKVFVRGRLKTSSYTDKNGVSKKSVSVVVSDVIFLSPNTKAGLYEAAEDLFN